MTVRITTLCENTADFSGIIAEYGWSALIETDEAVILFDTGQNQAVCHNADELGIDLHRIDKIVLSHGHYDHAGGLRRLLQRLDKKIVIYAHPDVWSARYTMEEDGERFVGIPFRPEELAYLGADFRLSPEPVSLSPNILTTGEIPMHVKYEELESPESMGEGWWIKEGNHMKPDYIMDDQALVVKTGVGLVVVLGCAHHGIINTIQHAQKLTGINTVYAVLGGSHLFYADDARIKQTVTALKSMNITKIGLAHCTGLAAGAIMSREFGDRFFFNTVGTVTEL